MILSEKTQAHLQFRTAANERRVASGEYQPSRGLHNTLSLAGDSGEIVWNAITGRDMDALKSMHASGWEGAKTAFLLGGPATMVNLLNDTHHTQTQDPTVQTDADGGIIQTEQSDGQQVRERVPSYDSLKLPEQDALGASTALDPFVETDGNPTGNIHEEAALLEQSFLSGLMGDEESGSIRGGSQVETPEAPKKPLTAHERLALEGKILLDKGGMPTQEQLAAMGIDKPTARGIQSLVWLSKENSPTARRAVEAMVDLTAPQVQVEQRQEADFTRVPVDADGHALIGFNGANSLTDARREGIDNYAGEPVGQRSKSGEITIPDCARNIAERVKNNNGTPLKGYKGGKIYRNTPVAEDSQKLPEGVNYREYDIHPYIKGENRGTERIVIGDDGLVWYTNDHYQTFTRIE